MKRTLSDYTIEELEKAALEQSPEGQKSTQEYETDVPQFLAFYQIKPGKDLVNKRIIFKLYKCWSENPVSTEKFGEQINLFIPSHQIGSQYFYHLNRKALDLSTEAYNHIVKHTHDRIKVPAWKAHFDKYLDHYHLKSGDFFIAAIGLYNLYDKFAYDTKKKMQLGYGQFIKFCRLNFEQEKMTKDGILYFGIDRSIKDFITDEQLQHLRKSKHLYGKETKQKI